MAWNYLLLARALREELASDSWSIGDKFLSMADVADRWGCSPTTAGKALNQLNYEGWLQTHIGVGSLIVAKPGEPGDFDPPPALERRLRNIEKMLEELLRRV